MIDKLDKLLYNYIQKMYTKFYNFIDRYNYPVTAGHLFKEKYNCYGYTG